MKIKDLIKILEKENPEMEVWKVNEQEDEIYPLNNLYAYQGKQKIKEYINNEEYSFWYYDTIRFNKIISKKEVFIL